MGWGGVGVENSKIDKICRAASSFNNTFFHRNPILLPKKGVSLIFFSIFLGISIGPMCT